MDGEPGSKVAGGGFRKLYALLLARLVTSLKQGAFGLGAIVAASIVPSEKQANAVATMFMGLTFAIVGGVPAAQNIALESAADGSLT